MSDGTPLAALAGIVNACEPLPGLITGGQPTDAQVRAAKAAGLTTLLDARDPMEPRPFDEPALAAAVGLRYENIPVSGATLDDATMERILSVVRDKTAAPVLFHCGSGNRVGGALIPYFMIDHGMGEEDAIALAMRVGLRGADLLHWGLDYASRHAASP
ncbi:MAG TPA: sulfur transferase domain-containing protein [Gemmatimonadales bacterium]|nr:sulfur transferase domain-containing protein [Gemmatimonadales bacterium]